MIPVTHGTGNLIVIVYTYSVLICQLFHYQVDSARIAHKILQMWMGGTAVVRTEVFGISSTIIVKYSAHRIHNL